MCENCKDTGIIIHHNGKDESVCQDCCEHEFDPDEGYMCLNCSEQSDSSLPL